MRARSRCWALRASRVSQPACTHQWAVRSPGRLERGSDKQNRKDWDAKDGKQKEMVRHHARVLAERRDPGGHRRKGCFGLDLTRLGGDGVRSR